MGYPFAVQRGPAQAKRTTGVALSAILALLALAVLPACGLLGGGVSQEEFDLVTSQLTSTKKELEAVDRLASAEKVKAADLQTQIKELQAQIDQAKGLEEEGRISLERARLAVIKYAQLNLDAYGPKFQNIQLVWEVESAEEQEEFYYIKLTFQPFSDSSGRSGLEEFILDKTGDIEFRQVLEEPDPNGEPRARPPPKESK